MNINKILGITILTISSALPQVWAKDVDQAVEKSVLSHLGKILKEKPSLLEESPIPGLYTVLYGTQLFFVSKDGRYAFEKPQMIDLETRQDMSDKLISGVRKEMVDKLDEKTMVNYLPTAPQKTTHTITVFTDIDCPYCQKLHNERDELLAEGVKIRYLMYPRAGVDTESFKTAEAVLCSEDQQKAMTDAKDIAAFNSKLRRAGGANPKYKPQVSAPKCESPVKEHMTLLHALGMEVATPQILLDSGELLRGYVPAKELLKILAKQEK